MADYDWGPPCGCGFMQGHRRLCKENPHYELNVKIDERIARERVRGFVYLGDVEGDITRMIWGCRRGCGAVVWDTDLHVEKVKMCANWSPVAGE